MCYFVENIEKYHPRPQDPVAQIIVVCGTSCIDDWYLVLFRPEFFIPNKASRCTTSDHDTGQETRKQQAGNCT
jgi:hypothetical protein